MPSTESNELRQFKMMTETPVEKLILKLSVPTIISMLVTNIYNLADTAFVGQINNSASGAVGVVFGFMAIIQAIGFMFGQGSGSITSRLLGNHEKERAGAIVSTALVYAFSVGVLLAVLGFVFIDDLIPLLGSTETIAPYAKSYMVWILAAAPFMMSSFVLNNALRYEGRASLGMIGVLSGAILNIICDPILMFGLKLGIAGAGISTAISQTIGFFLLLSMFLAKKTTVRLSLRSFIKDFRVFVDISTTGMPSMLRQGLASLATVLLNYEASFYGDEAVAAMSIVGKVTFFVFSVALGIGQGFQPVSGMNYGAKKYDRVRKAYRFTLVLAEALMVFTAIPVLILSGNLIGLFRDDPLVIEIGTRALRLHVLGALFLPPTMATEMLLQSTGKRLWASLLSSMRSGLFFIPILLLMTYLRGLAGIQEAQPLAYVAAFVPAVLFAMKFFQKLPQNA